MSNFPHGSWRYRLHEVVFEADTRAGKAFDVVLLIVIVASIAVVMLDSVTAIHRQYGAELLALEWLFTLLFTAEYLARLLSVRRPLRYAVSFFGVVDVLAILPTYLSVLIGGGQTLLVIRALRLLRIFRVLKLRHYVAEAELLEEALWASRIKSTVFLTSVLSIATIMGAVMYLVEGQETGFTSIPRGVYWAIVTMTTVGYGNIAPTTVPGQFAAGCLMILGYAIIAIPTGIVSVELAKRSRPAVSTQACLECGAAGHDPDALYCKFCGANLELDS